MTGHLLGIDLGTTVLKMAIFNANTGAAVAHAEERLVVAKPAPGAREIDMRSLSRAIRRALRSLREAAGSRWRSIEGIGLAAQGGSSIIADRATGSPHSPMFLWNDERCHPQYTELSRLQPPQVWSAQLSYAAPPRGLARILWLRERHPQWFIGDTIHIGAGEHLFFTLTGTWRQDPGNAIQVGSYHAYTKTLDATAFRRVDVPLELVAPLREGHEVGVLSATGAKFLGLAPGIPVAGPYIDQEAAYMSLMGQRSMPLQCGLGTAWVGNFILDDDDPWSSPMQMVLPSPSGKGRFVIQALPTGNVSWDWALDTFLGGHGESELRRAARFFTRALTPREGLMVVPWFAQANPWAPDLAGGGAALGISAHDRPGELVRAVAAGMVFELHRFLGGVGRRNSKGGVVLSGGASRGTQFRKLIAAAFQPTPVYWQRDYDLAAARGSLWALNPKAAHADTRTIPRPDQRVVNDVQRGCARYREVFASMYGPAERDQGYLL